MFPEGSADPIQSHWIRTRIEIGQAKSDDSEIMPERVVVLLCLWVEVEEEHENVRGQEANGEDQHEDEYGDGHFLSRSDL